MSDFQRRTDRVELSKLADLWPELFKGMKKDDIGFFECQQLQGNEWYQVQEVGLRYKTIEHYKKRASAKDATEDDRAALALALMGRPPENVDSLRAQHVEMVLLGVTKPKMDRPKVLRLFTHFVVEFAMLKMKIDELTGMGAVKKKHNSSLANQEFTEHLPASTEQTAN